MSPATTWEVPPVPQPSDLTTCPKSSADRVRKGASMGLSKRTKREVLWTTFRIVSSLVMSWSVGFAQVKVEQDKPGPLRLTKEGRKWAEQTLKGLSLEEKVGQMLQVRYYADYKDFDSHAYNQTVDKLQQASVAAMYF